MIPFNRPYRVGTETAYVTDALARGHASADGHYTRQCEALLAEGLGAPRVLLTPSCTAALELAALALGLGPGDEVILPSFTFVATANAFVRVGARPVFCDIREDTLNIDERRVEALCTDATRAVVAMSYAGVGCEMDALGALATARGLALVEDNAHGLWGRYRGEWLGRFGGVAAQSFHETKNFTCGEGGALVINDPKLVRHAEHIRHNGTNRADFLAGDVDKYTWVTAGAKLSMSDLLAAFLLAQLEARDEIQRRRRALWERYEAALRGWATRLGAQLPLVPAHCEQTYHMFYLVMPDPAARDGLISALRAAGALAVFHYQPLHTSPFGRAFADARTACPVSESVSARLVRLPFFTGMTEEEQSRVIEAVLAFG